MRKHAGYKTRSKILSHLQKKRQSELNKLHKKKFKMKKKKRFKHLQDQVASLSVLIASKVIEKEISAQDQDKLIEEYIKEVGEER